MIYEVRIYTIVPGRLDVALERFERGLPPIFARHGIRNVGRWVGSAGSQGPSFVYMMAYHDLAERERQWDGFYADPDWPALRSATQGDEEATERFDISFLRLHEGWRPAPPASAEALGGIHDLIFAEVAIGKAAAADAYLFEHYLPAIERAGGEVMLVSNVIAGPALPRLALMFAWRDAATRQAAWASINTDPELAGILARQRREFGRSVIGRTDSLLLDPTRRLLPDATLGRAALAQEASAQGS